MILPGDARRLPLADESVDLVLGSPPYLAARDYREEIPGPEACPKSAYPWRNKAGKWFARYRIAKGLDEWVEWMLAVTSEAARVSRGLVMWVCCGTVDRGRYQPGPEAVLARWVAEGRGVAWRPLYWHRYGIPGYQKWCRSVVETVLVFAAHGRRPWSDPLGDAGIKKPGAGRIYGPRRKDGSRKTVRRYRATDGAMKEQVWTLDRENPERTIQTNLISVHVGQNHLGHEFAKRNEAPYPVQLVTRLIPRACPPGGLILDCFGGSGTTAHAAYLLGRRCISIDMRASQRRLMAEREVDVRTGGPKPSRKRKPLRDQDSGLKQTTFLDEDAA